jgi:aryl-alcohol dehydrogenase-like predicted oxidoreductase
MTDNTARVLGRTGVMLSPLTLGAMNFGRYQEEDESIRIIHAALDAGITAVDTADVYGQGQSEEIVGKALQGRRDDIFLATKFHGQVGDNPAHAGNSRRWIVRAVEDSLRRLGTDHIDLYQAHRPDPQTDLLETLQALNDLIHQGKIGYYGTSAFPAHQLVEAHWLAEKHGLIAPHTEQLPYSLLVRGAEREVFPVVRKYGVGVISFGPLAAGWLSGKYRVGGEQPQSARAGLIPGRFDIGLERNQRKLAAADALARLAEENGLTLVDLALAFALDRDTGRDTPSLQPAALRRNR